MKRFFVAALLLFCLPACADTFTVTFHNAFFSDGGSLTGWVTSTNGALTSSISVAGGDTSTFAPFTYTESNTTLGSLSTGWQLSGTDFTHTRFLDIKWVPAATGDSPLIRIADSACADSSCVGGSSRFGYDSGTVTIDGSIPNSTGVPEPGSFTLLAVGILVRYRHAFSKRLP